MGTPTKILVVDDEKIITDILKRRFERIGFDVFSAHSGENAIQLIEQNHFDLVICDVKIPTTKTIEDVFRASQFTNSKFVVMSGNLSSDHSVKSILKAGAPLFIKKPFPSLKEVTSEIVKIIN